MNFSTKTIGASLTLLVLALAAFPLSQAETSRTDYLVHGASGQALAARGYEVIDDYAVAATARLVPSQAAQLEAEGLALTPLSHETGRGSYRFDPTGPAAEALPYALQADPATPYQIVQFRGPVKSEWRSLLGAVADDVYDYLPDNAFLARLGPAAREFLAERPEVRAILPYHPAFKLAPELPATGSIEATVLGDLALPLDALLAQLRQAGAAPTAWTTAGREHVVDAVIAGAELAEVARLDAVLWIEPSGDLGSADNDQSSAITQGGATGAWPVHAKGVDGSSQKVSICDTGANTNVRLNQPPIPWTVLEMIHEMHDDDSALGFLEYNAHRTANPPGSLPLPEHKKIDLYYSPLEDGQNRGDPDDLSGHGTHTAGTLAGNKAPFDQRNDRDGVAYAAKLLICDITTGLAFNVLNDYANYWNPAYDRGARINSNSWGSVHTNAYTEKARQHDLYVWDHRDFVILRSMGNTGATGMIRPEAVAKNALGVGAVQNGGGLENLASFSTGGLTQDGRIKPNVVAPGDCLTSSTLPGRGSYVCISGTSMSTPTTSGAAALVRDYFTKGYYPTGEANAADGRNPSSALVRAVLQASGKEITGDRAETGFPNKAQGWGRVLLDDVLFFAGDARKLIAENEGDALATGDVASTEITVTAGQPLRIMLSWVDRAGAAGADPALVNNLDLRVTGPGGELYRGNAFVGNQVPANQGTPDAKNVDEAVYLNAPAGGSYTIEVVATNVPDGPQPFALVVTGDVA